MTPYIHIHEGRGIFILLFIFCCAIKYYIVILITGRRGIGPQLLQFVKFTQFCLKNMHHHIHVVHSDPQRILLSFHAPDLLAEGFQYLLLDTRRDRSDLRGGVGVANDEAGADRPSIFERSNDTIFLPFLSWIARIIVPVNFSIV